VKLWQSRFERECEREKKKGEEKLEELSRRKDSEFKAIKEQARIEQEEWKEAMLKKMAEDNAELVKKIREDMVRERNREIEAIINKLGDETHDT